MIWVKEPKDIKIKSDEDVAIDCLVDGELKPIIKWIDIKGLAQSYVTFFFTQIKISLMFRQTNQRPNILITKI